MYVYVMKYENENFFIGACKNIDKINSLKIKTTGDWVKSKVFVSIDNIYDVPQNITYQKFKNYTVAKYMSRYGMDSVRGGSWTSHIIPAHGTILLESVIERINFDYEIAEIKQIYEEELRMVDILLCAKPKVEELNYFSVKLIKCPLCRVKIHFTESPKLYKSIENDCVICMDKKCEIICNNCCVPFSCSTCYLCL